MRHAALLTVLLAGCIGEAGLGSDAGGGTGGKGDDPFAPCVEQAKCCTSGLTVCWGDPDKGTVCKCQGLWDCSQNPKKCQQETPVPPGGHGGWTCTWTASSFVCTGTPSSLPPGGGGWSCEKAADGVTTCTKATPPNPTNGPAGVNVWSCTVQAGLLVCDRATPTPDQGTPVTPTPKKETNCADGIDNDGDGLVDCKDPDCPACKPACPAGQECCDGVDNDGDAQIDEGNVCGKLPATEPCPPGAIQSCDCYCGVHRKCKADGTWGPCTVDSSCQPAQVISQSACGNNAYCDFGECVPLGPFGFGIGKQCKHHNDCPVGKICDLGECIVDPYQPWNCP